MITYEKALEIIEFQKQQIANLTVERDRLREESAEASEALVRSNTVNAELAEKYHEVLAQLDETEIESEENDSPTEEVHMGES